MALLNTQRLPLIKLLARQQACFKTAASAFATNSKSNHCQPKSHQLLFPKNKSDKLQIITNTINIRNASTTTKKGNVISFTHEIGTHPFVDLNQSSQQELDLSFEDSQTAFKSKSNFELIRGYLVFQLCGIKFLLENQKTLLDVSRVILGKNLFNQLMKNTFYGHFVAGENSEDIRANVENMRRYGVKSILDYSAEEDLEAAKSSGSVTQSAAFKRHIYDSAELQSEKNLKIFMDCIDTVEDVTQATGLVAIKITSLIRPALLLKYSTLVDQVEKYKVTSDLFSFKNMLKKSDEEFACAFNNVTELANLEDKLEFTTAELGEIRNMFSRLDDLGKKALGKKVRMFVDAEQTYFQAAIRRVTIEMMRVFNKDQCTVMNTYQNYLKSAYSTLATDMDQAKREGYLFGAKLVRGAYMDQERDRAHKMGYEDPINESYNATTQMYESSFNHCLEEIRNRPGSVNIMVASHNEETVRYAVKKMEEYGVRPNDRAVCFGQLYGMCDFITFYLGGNGFSAFKYVPYGPVEEVLPYLSRRATENGKGVFEKVEKEKRLALGEIMRRFKNLEFI